MWYARAAVAAVMLVCAFLSLPAAGLVGVLWLGFEAALATNRRAGSSD